MFLAWLDVFYSVKFFRAMLVGVVLTVGVIPTIQADNDCTVRESKEPKPMIWLWRCDYIPNFSYSPNISH